MLPIGDKFLVEEKTITYVTSAREVLRIYADRLSAQSQSNMGNSW
jgi:hypothetical protein